VLIHGAPHLRRKSRSSYHDRAATRTHQCPARLLPPQLSAQDMSRLPTIVAKVKQDQLTRTRSLSHELLGSRPVHIAELTKSVDLQAIRT
jgi:hypothetical protein